MALIYPLPLRQSSRLRNQVEAKREEPICPRSSSKSAEDGRRQTSFEDWTKWSESLLSFLFLPLSWFCLFIFLYPALLILHASVTFPVPHLGISAARNRAACLYRTLINLLSIIALIVLSLDGVVIVAFWVANASGINRAFSLAFQIITTVMGNKLFWLARRWPKLTKRWSGKEAIFLVAPYKKPRTNFNRIFTAFSLLVVLVAIVD